jgi:Domain of unknown function (DUF1707)
MAADSRYNVESR